MKKSMLKLYSFGIFCYHILKSMYFSLLWPVWVFRILHLKPLLNAFIISGPNHLASSRVRAAAVVLFFRATNSFPSWQQVTLYLITKRHDLDFALSFVVSVVTTAAGAHSLFCLPFSVRTRVKKGDSPFYYFLKYLEDTSVGFTEEKLLSFRKPQQCETPRSPGLCQLECQLRTTWHGFIFWSLKIRNVSLTVGLFPSAPLNGFVF